MATQIRHFAVPVISDYLTSSSSSNRHIIHMPSQHVLSDIFIEHKTILLGTLSDGRVHLISPFKVVFVRDEDQIVAEATEINEFGFGNDFSEALLDLQHTISELYFTLELEQERLGTDLQNTWAILQNKISKK